MRITWKLNGVVVRDHEMPAMHMDNLGGVKDRVKLRGRGEVEVEVRFDPPLEAAFEDDP